MKRHTSSPLTRRQFLAIAAASAGLTILRSPRALARALDTPVREFEFELKPATARLLGRDRPAVPVWSYNGKVPGPEIRVRQGQRLRVAVTNRLEEETTVHWHGVRVPNAQDGVPHLTQKPIAPGERYVYEFDCIDAGTFWYHPHQRSFEQVGRGLYGPLIVEEQEAMGFDRDVTWVLDDWRIAKNGKISETFGHPHDMSHGGRIGNTVTLNGSPPSPLRLRAGERVRLRIINAANARIFALTFADHAPRVIALDGQPVEPHLPADGRIVVGPAMRVDLLLDATGEPGERYTVRDVFYEDLEYDLLELAYDNQRQRKERPSDVIALPPNPLTEPDLRNAKRHEIRFQGGMMGDLSSATLDGRRMNMMQMMMDGKAWAVNGVVATDHTHAPVLTLKHGRSYRLDLVNDTAWPHPMHLHGHSFRVIRRNGRPTAHREWQDTVLMAPKERVEIAFVADNPGDWMFHCHILEHQAGGMMSVIRVT